MDLRDELAIRRTILANQRTLLTFFNASLALMIGGLTLIKFFSGLLHGLGWMFLPAGVILFLYGFRNYFRHKQMIEAAYK